MARNQRRHRPAAARAPYQRRRGSALLHALFVASGVAGLGYQLVWTRMFAVGLGHEAPSMLAVLTAFFAGLALGAWLLDRRIAASPAPARWYIGLELLIAIWSCLTLAWIPAVNVLAPRLTGTAPGPALQWLVALALPLLALLPATMAMGATLPAVDRLALRLSGHAHTMGGLYAANTLGAMLGALGTTYLIVPALGHHATVMLLAALNVACALAMLALMRSAPEATAAPPPLPAAAPIGALRLSLTLALTGLLGIGYEVLAVCVMARALQNTIYSFTHALAVYLLGTALGAAAYQRWARGAAFHPLLNGLLIAQTTACLLGALALGHAPALHRALTGGGGSSLVAELALAFIAFLPPTFVMGLLFSHLAQAARHITGGVGRALAMNTLGGASASLVFGVVLLPMIGAKAALGVLAAAYLVAATRRWALAVPAPAALLFALLPPSPLAVAPPPGARMLTAREGILGCVVVHEDAHGDRVLTVNNHFDMGGTASAFGERRQAHLPLLLHPAPRAALFLGVGTGITFHAAARHPGLSAVGVELLPDIVATMSLFVAKEPPPAPGARLTVYTADARRFVATSRERFDVIVADLFHPARDGASALYTVEHFAAVRERLAQGGLFAQWLPLYQLDIEDLRLVLRSYLRVFPEAHAFLLHYNTQTPAVALIAGLPPWRVSLVALDKRVADGELAQALERIALPDPLAVLAGYLAGPEQLAAFAGVGALNTDNQPLIAYHAPALVYQRRPPPTYGRLVALLDACTPTTTSLLPTDETVTPAAHRLVQVWRARELYLRGCVALEEGDQARGHALWLESARTSRDFHTGYAMLLAHAVRLAERDTAAARTLLEQLAEAQPQLPDAPMLLRRLR